MNLAGTVLQFYVVILYLLDTLFSCMQIVRVKCNTLAVQLLRELSLANTTFKVSAILLLNLNAAITMFDSLHPGPCTTNLAEHTATRGTRNQS